MAFTCTYDDAVTNVGVDPDTPVELSDANALVNAANELKTYLNTQGGFNENINANAAWGGDPTIIDSDLVLSLRTMLEEIDPTSACSCNYVCSNDNECTCNSQGTTCTCIAESHCSSVCGCDYDCSCNNNCACDIVYTT